MIQRSISELLETIKLLQLKEQVIEELEQKLEDKMISDEIEWNFIMSGIIATPEKKKTL